MRRLLRWICSKFGHRAPMFEAKTRSVVCKRCGEDWNWDWD